jgi:hypothetical protein
MAAQAVAQSAESSTEFKVGIYYDVNFEDYKKIDAVNASFIKRFASCPASVNIQIEQTRNMIIGSAIHALTLEGREVYQSQYATAPQCDRRTKEGKAIYADFEASAPGKTVITIDEEEIIRGCYSSLMAHSNARKLLDESEGQPEVTLMWIDEETGLPCKARLDRLPDPSKGLVIDLKSTSDASKKGFVRQICNLSYDLQAAHYMMGCKALNIGAEVFAFVGVQTSKPYPVTTCFMNSDWMIWAKCEINRLMSLIKESKELNFYPAWEVPSHIYSFKTMTSYDLLEELEMPKFR